METMIGADLSREAQSTVLQFPKRAVAQYGSFSNYPPPHLHPLYHRLLTSPSTHLPKPLHLRPLLHPRHHRLHPSPPTLHLPNLPIPTPPLLVLLGHTNRPAHALPRLHLPRRLRLRRSQRVTLSGILAYDPLSAFFPGCGVLYGFLKSGVVLVSDRESEFPDTVVLATLDNAVICRLRLV
jgi:hypothetical protein